MTDKNKPAGSKPDHVLGAGPANELERDTLTALPLLVRLAVKVCSCTAIETEHDLRPNGTRGACSHRSGALACACREFEHAVDRYAVSTYVDAPAGMTLPADPVQLAYVLGLPTVRR